MVLYFINGITTKGGLVKEFEEISYGQLSPLLQLVLVVDELHHVVLDMLVLLVIVIL